MEPINGTPVDPPVEAPTLEFSGYGPKRVKTKEMEIEQFDPSILAKIEERKAAGMPTFCNTPSCVGRHKYEIYPQDC